MTARIVATYRMQGAAADVEARAEAIALEQSVELPLDAVRDPRVRAEVVARVEGIVRVDERTFDLQIGLAIETIGGDAGQLLNMLFGNTSLQPDVGLEDVQVTEDLARLFGGPRFGIGGWRELTKVTRGPLSCTALKPQGLAADALADLAGLFARAGIDVIKDDHGLADQAAAPFEARVRACQAAIDRANAATGGHAVYAPSLTGSLDAVRRQLDCARASGVRAALVAPMVSGASNLQVLAREAGLPLIAHPALAGLRASPALLLGKLFRLLGADATIFPNVGGRFSYSAGTCRAVAAAARDPSPGLAPALPVPAGGMSVARLPEMHAMFGDDTMFLIGGSLLRETDVEGSCRRFGEAVRALGTEETTNA